MRDSFLAGIAAILLCMTAVASEPGSQIQVTFDSGEAEAALTILDKEAKHTTVSTEDWQKLFSTTGYKELKATEAGHVPDFDGDRFDDKFKVYLSSPELVAATDRLRTNFQHCARTGLRIAEHRVATYLPPETAVHANIFPVIAPSQRPAYQIAVGESIFIDLDICNTGAQYTTAVAVQLYRLGAANVLRDSYSRISKLPVNAQTAAEWTNTFEAGVALLVASGTAQIHPFAWATMEERERWDHKMAGFPDDLKLLDSFFLEIVKGQFKTKEAIAERGDSFFDGEARPWEVVGYKMASVIETRFGRKLLINVLRDPRWLLAIYNQAAEQPNSAERLPRWSPALLEALGLSGGGSSFR